MNLFDAALLGLIQGLTEFLPVSSSGHLVLFQDLLGLNEPGVTLEVLLHFGTLLAVFFVFGKDFIALFKFFRDEYQRHFLILLILGVLVTGILGLLFEPYIELLFSSTLVVGFMLLITGLINTLIKIIPHGQKNIADMKLLDALLIGLWQAFAIIPGISRSGTTILTALWRGLDRDAAVRFSFMLSAPVIFGATLIEARELITTGLERVMLFNYLTGTFVALVSGVFAIKFLVRILSGNKFHYFAYYCWVIGLIVIIFSLINN
ncbi:MAG: undecaprenyl-diphosphate phosphatase [Firmicutes bacterium]|nr:undecaprenyl-diphosphate phosphatase [Bacillota bacterium]